jgi:RND family efflux transporter MFP subunit
MPVADTVATIRAPLAQVERLEVPTRVELYGTVEAEKTASVSTRVMAMVTAVHVQAGDPVRQGQLLLDIDPQAARGQLGQAQGALAQARAGLSLAQRNYERFQGLQKVQAASELELDMARMQYEQALGAVEQAEGGVSAAASVAADTRVVAPFAGHVGRRMVEVGDLAAPGRPLLELESSGNRRLVLTVPESLMARSRLQLGHELAARIDARPELGVIRGNVVEMAPGADPASHTFQVKIALPRPDLPSGSAARAWLETDRRSAVTVPPSAVLRQGGMSLVVVRNQEGRALARVVTLGETVEAATGQRVEVLSGLTGGETVLLDLAAVPALGTRVEEAS